jgi:prepilin-type N-terminal cleavage/methylation domain-containing protein
VTDSVGRRGGPQTTPCPDDSGFTLVEVVMSIAVIGIVMSALTTFFVQASATISLQGDRQTAVQIATDASEKVRLLNAANLTVGRGSAAVRSQWRTNLPAGVATQLAGMQPVWDPDAPPSAGVAAVLPTTATPVTVNNIVYQRSWYIGSCWKPPTGTTCGAFASSSYLEMLRVVVAVTWTGRGCPNEACTFVETTLISPNTSNPQF